MSNTTKTSKLKAIIYLILALVIFCIASIDEQKSDEANQQELDEFIYDQLNEQY